MSADLYLGFASLLISYFLKVAVACLLCWILAALLQTPRQKFTLWLGLLFGSLIYWLYAVSVFSASSLSAATAGGAVLPLVGHTPHSFLVSARFQEATLILGRILGSAYILGVLLLAALGMWRRIRLRWLLRQGNAPSAGLQRLFSEMCRHFGVRHCDLRVLSGVNSPATVYWWRPRIVLPQVCEQLGESCSLADILAHELAHVARRDYLWSSISNAICGLLFFHPAVWQARKQMRIQREMACDLAVVSARPEHRADYAQTLTRIARLCLPRKFPVAGIDFASAPSLLRHRVEAILDEPEKNSRTRTISRALAGMALLGAYGFLCSAMAVAIAFAPSSQPQSAPAAILPNSPAASAPAHKIRRPRTQPEAGQMIAESPAHRLPSASDSSSYALESAGSPEQGIADPTPSNGPFPALADPKRDSPGRTVESVIVATVGTVLSGGSDKDDRSKKK